MEHAFAVSLYESQRILSEEIQAIDIECTSGGNIRILDCSQGGQHREQCINVWNDLARTKSDGETVKIMRMRTILKRHERAKCALSNLFFLTTLVLQNARQPQIE